MAKRPVLALACTLACTIHFGSESGVTSFVVGPNGGRIWAKGGISLEIPPGALHEPLGITSTTADAPEGALSRLQVFEPDGVILSLPATATFSHSGNEPVAVYWSTPDGGYERIYTTVRGGVATAQISRLGSGYLGPGPESRTVAGRLSTTFAPDNGTPPTTRGGVFGYDMHVVALWIPAGGRMTRIAVTEEPDSSFSAPGVPPGLYYLEIDSATPGTFQKQLFGLTTSTPDLSVISAARPDLRLASRSTPITLSLSNMTPWVWPSGAYTGDQLMIAGTQANVYGRPRQAGFHPTTGATAWQGNFDWRVMSTVTGGLMGLPDAAKGDVEYLYQRSTLPVGSGVTQGAVHAATRYARLTNLTVDDGAAGNINLALTAAPQTGAVRADIRGSQWTALMHSASPGAYFDTVSAGGFSVLAFPHSLTFPDTPNWFSTSLFWVQSPDGYDVDYGTLNYGQFLDASYKEARYAAWFFGVSTPSVTGGKPIDWTGTFTSLEPMPVADAVVPHIGPPRSPRINGRDAFSAQASVGPSPVFSWSPPALGQATSYTVSIWPAPGTPLIAGSVTIQVHGATSVTLPPGLLTPGVEYVASISAISAPWDATDVPPLRFGLPQYTAECVTGGFTL